jgi:hypothetical protein
MAAHNLSPGMVIELIAEGFRNRLRPPGFDGVDLSGHAADEVFNFISNKSWHEVSLIGSRNVGDIVSGLSDEGYRYYMPAFLTEIVRSNFEHEDLMSVVLYNLFGVYQKPDDVTLSELARVGIDHATVQGRMRKRNEGFTEQERQLIATFFRYAKSNRACKEEDDDLERAAQFWEA